MVLLARDLLTAFNLAIGRSSLPPSAETNNENLLLDGTRCAACSIIPVDRQGRVERSVGAGLDGETASKPLIIYHRMNANVNNSAIIRHNLTR